MKSQCVGLLIHSSFLALCLMGGFGFEMAENLFSAVMVFWSVFWWVAFYSQNEDELWIRRAPGAKPILAKLIRSLIVFQITFAFALGWFWVGGLHLFTTLLVYGRQLQAKNRLAEG